jgi:hypothetical protein
MPMPMPMPMCADALISGFRQIVDRSENGHGVSSRHAGFEDRLGHSGSKNDGQT